MHHAITLTASFSQENHGDIVFRSLQPEVSALRGGRSRTHLTRRDNTIVIEIEAADLVTLRAAQNTWSSLLRTAERVLSCQSGRRHQ